MASGVPWIGDAVGSGILSLRAVADFPGHLHPAHPHIHHFRLLRLFPVFFSIPRIAPIVELNLRLVVP